MELIKITTVYLIRHSAPFVEIDNYENYENVLWSDFNRNMILSSEGETNAKKLCSLKELENIDEIYASDSVRAIGTAKYLAEINKLKIKLDDRINERESGIKYIKDLPKEFNKISFDDKNYKMENGESLNDVDKRFNSFIDDLLNKNIDKAVVVMHGIILLSYLNTVCKEFEYDGKKFHIKYDDKIILDGNLTNPSIYKIEFDNNRNVVNVSNIECH